jgi:ParB-like chromosome segregation protein Spo0J
MTDDTHKLFDVLTLPVEDIDPDPNQPRSSMTGIDELAASIADYGQLTPIRVRKVGNRYRIIGGERRWTAVKSLGHDTIYAYVATSDDAEVALIELADNLHVPLTPEEVSRGTQRVFSFDVPVERIASATGVKAEVVERAKAGWARVADEAVSEPMTLEQLAAIQEFADDDEAVKKLTTSPRWEQVARDLRMERKLAAAVAEKRAIIEAAGVELLETVDYTRHRLGLGDEMPEGAVAASVTGQHWNGSADIVWYGAASETGPTPEQIAEREAREAAREALEAAHAARMDYILRYTTALKGVAEDAWEGRKAFEHTGESWNRPDYRPDAQSLPDDEQWHQLGFSTRMCASVLVALEHQVKAAFSVSAVRQWQVEGREKGLIAYLDALADLGYEPDEVTAARIKELREFVKPKRKAKKEATDE